MKKKRGFLQLSRRNPTYNKLFRPIVMHYLQILVRLELILLCGCLCSDVLAAKPKAISTFESIGIYWNVGYDAPGGECSVRYRVEGADAWQEALPLWYDKRNGEYRGSILNLKPGTTYEIQLSMDSAKEWSKLKAKTWSETFPLDKTVYLDPGKRSKPLVTAMYTGT